MTTRLKAAVLGGLAGGTVMGVLMTIMQAPTPDGGSMPMMAMVAMILGSSSLVVGWAYHLVNSAVIGALFGLWLGEGAGRGLGAALTRGAAYGVFWWVLGGLVLMPLLLGMPAFAPLTMAPMRMTAMASLMGHLIFGLFLGFVYLWVQSRHRHAATVAG